MPESLAGLRIHITGVVQGVGFRPYVYGLAQRHGLPGWVCNTSAGVDIEVDGPPEQLSAFVQALRAEAPPLARIDTIEITERDPDGFTAFEIRRSRADPGQFQPVSPDVSICPDCLRELFDPADRRYRYPFINCTNCGPRFTIIKDIPYDRPLTTMAPFEMCPDCAREYHDPLDRRFHAQPVACPVCGPGVWLVMSGGGGPDLRGEDAIGAALDLLRGGKTVAVKGLGGFHLACDATDEAAVAELRRRKGRVDKPLAVMMADLASVERYCRVSPAERALLDARQRPIVLLWSREGAVGARRAGAKPPERSVRVPSEGVEDKPIAPSVAPGQPTLGVMLPYTPLHYLLFPESDARPLVMTSGNFAEEPIATDNDDAVTRLAPLADAFLLHDRDIHVRTDDSVVRVFAGHELPVRRSRGYAPYPVRLPFDAPPILATGAELKNTFCLTRDRYAFLSHHIGDLENLETLRSLEQGVTHFETLFRIQPQIIAHDLHPDYLATRYALARAEQDGLPTVAVQHHHAHVAACMAENGDDGGAPVIGVSFDGTGYGPDGAIWGGEFLIATYAGYERAAHLRYVPLPGGDAATRKPARAALAHLITAGVHLDADLPPVRALSEAERRIVGQQVEKGLNAPPTSSMGRLFDALSSIAGLRHEVNYEGQAAIELEALVDPGEGGAYAFDIGQTIDAAPVIRAAAGDQLAGIAPAVIAARFHNGLAAMIRDVCLRLRAGRGIERVALSGGVFQNVTLLGKTLALLRAEGFDALTHRLVPPNDGGLALGQAVIARAVHSK